MLGDKVGKRTKSKSKKQIVNKDGEEEQVKTQYARGEFVSIALIDLTPIKLYKLKVGSGANNMFVWYKKGEDFWGLTIKSMPKEKMYGADSNWKLSWYYNKNQGALVPVKDSADRTEAFDGDYVDILKEIVENDREKKGFLIENNIEN